MEEVHLDRPAVRKAAAVAAARKYAADNHPDQGNVLDESDVAVGNWNPVTEVFTPDGAPVNAVRVVTRRTRAGGNPIPLFFARVFGVDDAESAAEATAVLPSGTGGRFLIDDEAIDTDEPAIEAIKSRFPDTPVEHFLTDRNNDFFIDLYAYLPLNDKRITVRTGQVGDEGLFDITANAGTSETQFPFGTDTTPSFTDFLKYNKSGSPAPWSYKYSVENKLKPELKGVGRFNDRSKYPALVHPDYVHVSPVYKSDINSSDSVGQPAKKGVVGGQDERRGLLAFKIVGWANDPRGSSYLPNLTLEIVNPVTVSLDSVKVYTAAADTIRLAR